MTPAPSEDWLASEPKPPVPAQPPKSRASDDWLSGGDSQPAPEKKGAEPKPGWLTRSALTWVGMRSPSEYFDGSDLKKTIHGLMPSGSSSDSAERFITEVYRAGGAEMLDFATSPAGIGLMALHAIPQTRPIATVVDYALGAQQTLGAAEAFDEFRKTHTPESLARGFVAAGGAFLAIKGGRHMLEKNTPAYSAEPPGIRQSRLDATAITAKPEGPERVLELQKTAEPKTVKEKVSKAIYSTPVVRNVASMMYAPKTRVLEIGSDLVNDRAKFMGVRNQEVGFRLQQIRKSVDPAELSIERMGYVIEGDLTPAQARLSPEGVAALADLRKMSHEQTDLLKSAYGKDLPLKDAETYLAHIWDFKGDAAARRRAAYTLMKDPFLKERTILSYKEGIEQHKWAPKFDNVLDIVKVRADFATKAIANQRMANSLREIGAILTEDEVKKITKAASTARSATTSGGMLSTNIPRMEAVGEWQPAVESRALNRATYIGKGERGEAILERKPVYVHPDIEQAVNAVFGKPFEHPAFDAMEAIRAWGKKTSLMWSFFHNNALSEQSQAEFSTRGTLGDKVGRSIRGTWVANPDYYKGIKTGMWEVAGKKSPHDPPAMRLANQSSVRDAIAHGLNLTTEDMESRAASQMRQVGLHRGPVMRRITAPVRGVGHSMHVMDRGLWDFYHQGQMINAYETILSSELGKYSKLGKTLTEAQISNLKNSISDHVNNAYGALNFERMLVSPKMRQVMNFALLAPSWTISNVKVFAQAFENEAGVRLASQYAAGALLSWFVTANMMNYALSSYFGGTTKDGKQHIPGLESGWFLWDNAGAPMVVGGKRVGDLTERSLSVYAGYNHRPDGTQGTQRYLNWGKGFKEPFIEAMSPFESLMAKSSLPIRTVDVFRTGHEPGSGYEVVDPKATPTEQTWQRWSALSDLAVPFVFRDYLQYGEHYLMPETFPKPRQSSQLFSLPASSGLSQTRATQLYIQAKDRGDEGTADAILKAAEYNNLVPSRIIAGYRDRIKKRARNRGND